MKAITRIFTGVDTYYWFLLRETPNVIGILSVISILSLILNDNREDVVIVISILFFLYLVAKSSHYMGKELVDELWPKPKEDKNLIKYVGATWTVLLLITGVGFYLFTHWIVDSIGPVA